MNANGTELGSDVVNADGTKLGAHDMDGTSDGTELGASDGTELGASDGTELGESHTFRNRW